MIEVYPHVPLIDNLGLGIALLSYAGRIFWGFSADYDVVPDLDEFVAATSDSFGELLALAQHVAASETAKPRARRRSPAPAES